MPKIQVQLLAGAGGPAMLEFTRSPVTFGRDQASDVVLTVATASRQHGELLFQDGAWLLVNLSPNATFVEGKRVSGKPLALNDRAVVSIGESQAFRVIFSAAENRAGSGSDGAGSGEEESDAPAAPPRDETQKKRSRLWTYIGVYMIAMLVLMIALSLMSGSKKESDTLAPELTAKQIEDDIRRPLTVTAKSEEKAREQMDDANEYLAKQATSPDALYRAHHAYKLALAYQGKQRFDIGPDQLRFDDVEKRLIADVTKQYDLAYGLLRSQQFKRADDEFRKLTQAVYPDSTSAVFQNASKHRASAAAKVRH